MFVNDIFIYIHINVFEVVLKTLTTERLLTIFKVLLYFRHFRLFCDFFSLPFFFFYVYIHKLLTKELFKVYQTIYFSLLCSHVFKLIYIVRKKYR